MLEHPDLCCQLCRRAFDSERDTLVHLASKAHKTATEKRVRELAGVPQSQMADAASGAMAARPAVLQL